MNGAQPPVPAHPDQVGASSSGREDPDRREDDASREAGNATGAPSWDALVGASGLPRNDTRALAEQASGRRREWLIAHGDEPADEAARERFLSLVARARAGEPIAYLLGWREFHGRRFEVGPAVLIPREDTERLVQLACERLPSGARLADLGTGSGCIAITLACERPDLQITATDVSPEALETARRNARALLAERRSGLGARDAPQGASDASHRDPPADDAGHQRIRFLHGDWHAALPTDERFDAIVSNPPYIAQADPHLSQGDLRHEPLGALTDGGDGLGAIRRIIAGARERLVPGGWLMLEHGWDQAAAVRSLLEASGLKGAATFTDLSGRDRVSCARAPGSD